MIETPTATAFKVESDEVDAPILSSDQKSEKMQTVEADLFLVKQKPITSKMCTIMKHLRAQAGPLARFRGLHISLIYHAVHGCTVSLLTSTTQHPLLRPLIAIITTITFCRIQMVWTHVVISAPSTKSWYRRFPSKTAARHVLLPTAVFAIAEQAAIYVPAALLGAVGETYNNPEAYKANPEHSQKVALIQMFFVGLIAIGIFVLIVIPAHVTLKRVQASMLPEEDESIVPFDRTFAGKVKPEILGGTGAVSMLDAWKTFDNSARIRLMKLYLKIFVVSVTTTIIFLLIVVGEVKLITGDKFGEMVVKAHENMTVSSPGAPPL